MSESFPTGQKVNELKGPPASRSGKTEGKTGQARAATSAGYQKHPVAWPESAIMQGKLGSFKDLFYHLLEDKKAVNTAATCCSALLCSLTVIGCCYVCSAVHLIPEGKIGISMDDGKPKVYGPGRHFLMSPTNGNLIQYDVTTPHISRGSLHVLNVSDNQYGLAFVGGQPKVLFPGTHVLSDPMFEFKGFINQSVPVIQHGTLHRIIVSEGNRALAWMGDEPLMFTAGIYYFVSPLFKFEASSRINTNRATLGPFEIVTIDDGRVGIAYDKGILRILPPGEHWLNAQSNEKFLDFLPTTQQVRQLKTLDILTNDGLVVRVIGSITFRIADPHKAVMHIGSDDESHIFSEDITSSLYQTIMHRANDTLASLLTGTSVLTSAGMGFADSTVTIDSRDVPTYEGDFPVQPDTLRMDRKAHDHPPKGRSMMDEEDLNSLIRLRFKESLTHTLNDEWGVELSDMNVIDIEVMDAAVRSALAAGVRSNVEAVTDRKTAESKSQTLRIIAQGDRDAAKIETDGEVYAIEELAKAQLKAGQLLEQTPVAIDIRMAETAARALAKSGSQLVIAPDTNISSIMSLVGMNQRMEKMKSKHN
jgi:regulator of protease activity HflC (stomatin/prohibitin superfamily)